VLHTIEGAYPRDGDYDGGTRTLDRKNVHPHFILGYAKDGTLKVGQYLGMDVSGSALRSPNNSWGAIQIEIGVLARGPFTALDPPVAHAVKWLIHAVAGVFPTLPLTCPHSFNDSRNTPANRIKSLVRDWLQMINACTYTCMHTQTHMPSSPLTSFQSLWKRTKGIVGHQHSPVGSVSALVMFIRVLCTLRHANITIHMQLYTLQSPDKHWDPGKINCQWLAAPLGVPLPKGDAADFITRDCLRLSRECELL
jgi:hypothetical protein